ncbi:ATP-dependent DNA helicase RecQ [Deinobacterium chartae]|uniref:DNA helicase RecQ n=1 Tax=Deinobacterium chartae TaxID=521158 RepID=A0A841I102_9DEIO|nr:ATP-dependent DNA helicase RecQ [Deinobacterium chartae]
MEAAALEILKNVFGYDAFRGNQAEIVSCVAEGGDALVLMPTGGGKSLCYQVPALLRPGTGVVVSPLIALMKDQVDALLQLGVRAAVLNSSLSTREAREVERRLEAGELDLIYVAPERLLTDRFLELLDRIQVALFAIDEAHCVSQWGHDFRPEYLGLSLLPERYPQVPRIALTATADHTTRREIAARLHLGRARHFVSSFDRPNIRYEVVDKNNARAQLLEFIRREHPGEAGIVYCLSRKSVEQTAEWLEAQGLRALPYHAGLSPELRAQHQERFLREEGLIMVATVAFGMGIDKPDVRFVAHLELPKSLEGYYQETGRAGRDGLPSDAWMAYGLADVVSIRRMLASSSADEKIKRLENRKLEALLAFCETPRCRRQVLLEYFGETLAEPCGNCDTCLNPVETWDGTVAAQKALSAVYRTGQRFGAGHLIDVLQGRETERVRSFRHHTLSTFGVGQDLSDRQWRSVLRQLTALGYLGTDAAGHGSLLLTSRAAAVLRGEERVELRREAERPKRAAAVRARAELPEVESPELWEALRACRMTFAKAQGVPPYVVFTDVTLRALEAHRPRSLAEMAAIPGVGQSKLERYGEAFLEVIAPFPPARGGVPLLRAEDAATSARGPGRTEKTEKTPRRDSALETLERYQAGESVAEIARERGLSEQTVSGHLAELVRRGLLSLEEATGLAEDEVARLEAVYHTLPEEQRARLKPLYEAAGERYDYHVIRCVHARLHG